MEKYGTVSVENLVETLKTFVTQKDGQGLSPELRELVGILKCHRLRHRNDAHAFCVARNGMRILQDLLQDCERGNHDRDLALILGTIGNLCALGPEPRKMIDKDCLKQIINYLDQKSCSEVVCTVVRVVANLALDSSHVDDLHGLGVVNKFSLLLAQEDTDVSCKKGVTRALRILCTSEDCRNELKWSKGVEALVGALKSEHNDLAAGAVQALEVVSIDHDILHSLNDKEVMQCVVRFCSHNKAKVRRSALGVLLNAVKVIESRMALSAGGGIEMLVSLMDQASSTEGSDVTSINNDRPAIKTDPPTVRRIVWALCMCCRDVISRQRLRDCGGLEKMISMLANKDYSTLHVNIMSALVAYYFDEITLKQMVTKMGLLRTLNYHLQLLSKKRLEQRDEAMVESESGDIESAEESTDIPGSSDLQKCGNDKEEDMIVQETDSSTSLSTPSKTNHERLSFASSLKREASSDDVCSDDSSGLMTPPHGKRPRLMEDLDISTTTSTTSTTLLDSLLSSPSPFKTTSTPVQSPSDSITATEFKTRLEGQVVLMVSRISHLRDCLYTLSYPDTLTALLDYFACEGVDPNEYIFRVLNRVLTNAHCFQNCIITFVPSLILSLLRKPQPPSTKDRFRSMCSELLNGMSKSADSPYGQGVLEHLFLTGSEREKQAICLAAPLLSKSPRFCHRLMLDCSAYQVLCDMATRRDHLLYRESLDALISLGRKTLEKATHSKSSRYHANYHPSSSLISPFERRYPFLNSSFQGLSLTEPDQALEQLSHSSSNLCRFADSDHHPFDLTLVIHAPSKDILHLQVHKSILAEESDVFKVMFGGHYKESSSGLIPIHGVPVNGFLSMVHFLYGCGWNCKGAKKQLKSLQKSMTTCDRTVPPDVIYESSEQLLKDIKINFDDEERASEVERCLQTMACAGRFLLPELIKLCEHAAVNYITPGNVVPMFNFSQLHQCFCLGESCIRTLLAMPHSECRTDTLGELLASPEAEAALIILRLFLAVWDS